MSFAICCGQRMRCWDSRLIAEGVRRNRVCKVCGTKKVSIEREVESQSPAPRRVANRKMEGVECLTQIQKDAIATLMAAFGRAEK